MTLSEQQVRTELEAQVVAHESSESKGRSLLVKVCNAYINVLSYPAQLIGAI
jgi:hypothetical protein